MNKFFSAVLKTGVLSCLMGVILAGTAFGQDTDQGAICTPSVFKVTFNKFELKRSDNTYVTVFDTPTLVNIADAGAINTAVEELANKTFPAGEYTKLRVTISQNMTVAGVATLAAIRYITSGNSLGGAPEMVASPAGAAQEIAVTNPGGDVVVEFNLTGAPVTIAEGEDFGTVLVKIDLTNAFHVFTENADPSAPGYVYMMPGAPNVTVTGL